MSAWRTYRNTHTAIKRMGEGAMEHVAQRMHEKEALRAAIKQEDWVTRDEIMVERLGRRSQLWLKILFFPALLTIFWGWQALVTVIGLWCFRMYCMRQKMGEMMADVPDDAASAFTMLRTGVTVAILTVLAIFMSNKDTFWAATIGGWLLAGGILSIGLTKLHTYWVRLVAEDASAHAAADFEDRYGEEAIQEVEVSEPSRRVEVFQEDALVAVNMVYGTTKTIPRVFDQQEGFPAGVPYGDTHRFRHTYIVGKTGSGKSVFLRNMIMQDIKQGNGVVVLTHERAMFEDYLMPYYPSERIDDLIYFNPADTHGKVVGLNLFELSEGENPTFKAGEIYTVFERSLEELGASMKPILREAINALVHLRGGKGLRDLEALIDPQQPELRKQVIQSETMPDRTKRFWLEYEDSQAARTGFAPLMNRLGPLVDEPLLTTLSNASFNLAAELNRRSRVLCIDLSELRGPSQRIVGQVMIALLRETFYARDVQVKDKRFLPYYWYIDEFQQYSSSSETALLEVFNGLRKYNIGLTIAHQTTASISNKLLETIMGNVGTIGAMRLQDKEANYFAKELRVLERREAPGPKKKDTIEDVRAQYRRMYEGTHPQRATILKTLHGKILKMEAEAALRDEEAEDIERDPTLKLRPDLFLEDTMPEGHIILRGIKNMPDVKGSVFLQVPFEPVGAVKEEIFEYADYVMASQENYGKEKEVIVTAQSPPVVATVDDEDEYMIPRS